MDVAVREPRAHRIPTKLGVVHVREVGAGPAMVFWPSLLMDGRMWRVQAEHFRDRYRVLCIDSPGHGESEALRRAFTMEDCADCLAQILDALQVRDCVLLGNSWGGMMGGVFAARYPQRIRAAVLMNCTASAAGWRQRLEFQLLTEVIRYLVRIPEWVVRRAVVAFIGITSEKAQPEVAACIREVVRAANARSVRWAIRSVVCDRTDRHAEMARVRCPVLVVAGDEDRTFPVAETRAMAQAIPGSDFLVLPGIGHLAAMEAPATVNMAVERFLEPML